VRDERHQGALAPYLRAIRAHRIVVVLVTLVACAAAVAWHTQREPTYEAGAKILLTPLASGETTFAGVQVIRDSNDPTRTAQTAAALIESPQAAQTAAQRVAGGYSAARVEQAIKVRPEGQSNIIVVSAQAPDPLLAARLADAYATAALERRNAVVTEQIAPIVKRLRVSRFADDRARAGTLQSIAGDPTLSVSQAAVAPEDPIGAATWIVGLLAIVAGFTIAATAALLMEHLDRRVREEDDFRAAYPIPVLARVPKVRDRIFAGGDLDAVPPVVREAYRTLQVQIEQLGPASRVVMITSGSGSDGKTSVAINLARELVDTGHRVLLMDLDVRKPDLTRIVGLARSADVMTLANAQTAVKDIVVPAPRLPQLLVMPGGRRERHDAVLGDLAQRLPEIVAEARTLADYVVIDTAPLGWVSDALRLVPYIDQVVVVARPGTTERRHFEQLRDLLSRAGTVPAGMVIVAATGRDDDSYPYATDDDRRG
jgi:Mrp family chromosome partitioning ATPase/capsular polysaccharide biosynthesis protein